MKPILVHVHIFYKDMWEELKSCLKNINTHPYDLYVTMIAEDKDLNKDILSFKKDAKIEVVENRGFDVGPFIHILNQVNLDNYEYIIKLHTKRDVKDKRAILNNFQMQGKRWRNYLLSFIKTSENFNKVINILKTNPDIGMISNIRLIVKDNMNEPESVKKVKLFFEEKNMKYKRFYFVAGTMFIVKASLFKQLQNCKLTIKDFEEVTKKRDNEFAHAMERCFGAIVYSQDYKISSIEEFNVFSYLTLKFISKLNFLRRLWYFIYFNKITKSNRRLIKICKIPVFSWRLKK